jgi:hypothetical protein
LEWKMLVRFMTIWHILRPFGIHNLRPFGITWAHPVLVCLDGEKSGSPGCDLEVGSIGRHKNNFSGKSFVQTFGWPAPPREEYS